jgi:hypothetical protein
LPYTFLNSLVDIFLDEFDKSSIPYLERNVNPFPLVAVVHTHSTH